jgi:hypothetical protein
MPFKGGDPHVIGRAKGTPNRMTSEVRNVIAMAAFGLGGVPRLVAWAREDPANERLFWSQVYPKLLPTLVRGSGQDGAIPLNIGIDPLEIMRELRLAGFAQAGDRGE